LPLDVVVYACWEDLHEDVHGREILFSGIISRKQHFVMSRAVLLCVCCIHCYELRVYSISSTDWL